MNSRRIGASLAAAGIASMLIATPALAEEPTVSIIPAEPGTADAVALEVGPIKIGHASAQAGPEGSESDSSATANAVEINGEPPSEQFGGTVKGKGKSHHGELIGGSQEGLGSIRVAPSDAEVTAGPGGTGTHSQSSAALLELIGEGILRVDVARGEAVADHDGKDSKGFAQSDGARVYLGPENELTLIVLHAETRSDNTGETYLVGINDNKIGTNDQLSQCPLPLPEELAVANVNCVVATGGTGGVREVAAGVLDAGLTPIEGQSLGVSKASGKSADGSSMAVAAAPSPEPAPAPAAELPASAPAEAPSGMLPRTGVDGMGLLAAAGLAMTALGGVILGLGRRLSLG